MKFSTLYIVMLSIIISLTFLSWVALKGRGYVEADFKEQKFKAGICTIKENKDE